MTVDKLVTEYYKHNPYGHFFDTRTLRFFGERMSEMRVLKNTVNVDEHECYVLSSYQHNAPVPGRVYHYFDVETFDYVIV